MIYETIVSLSPALAEPLSYDMRNEQISKRMKATITDTQHFVRSKLSRSLAHKKFFGLL